jgi:hypothetical protein
MTDITSPFLAHDDISESTVVTVIALCVVALLAVVVCIIPPDLSAAADVPSLAQFYL